MTTALLILVFVMASLGVALPFLVVQVHRRRRDRMAAWLCPHCGKPFGQDAAAHWRGWRGDIQWTDQIFGQPYAGPLLQCNTCVRDVRLTWDGKAVEPEKSAVTTPNSGGDAWREPVLCLRPAALIITSLGLAVLVALLILIWKLAA